MMGAMEHEQGTPTPTSITSVDDGDNVVLTIETQARPYQLVWQGKVDAETALRIGHGILASAYGILAKRHR